MSKEEYMKNVFKFQGLCSITKNHPRPVCFKKCHHTHFVAINILQSTSSEQKTSSEEECGFAQPCLEILHIKLAKILLCMLRGSVSCMLECASVLVLMHDLLS